MRKDTWMIARGRWVVTLTFVLQMMMAGSFAPPVGARYLDVGAATLPFAGDDTFPVGATTINDPTTVSVAVDRAYGPLADDAGHLRADLIGKSVAADTALEVAPGDGAPPAFAVAVNGSAVVGAWQPAGASGVYRLIVPTAQILFPKPGDADHALAPRTDTLTFSGASATLNWLRLVVPGTPPVLLMAGADLSCGPTGPVETPETWNDWSRWLTADGVPSTSPARDGHLTILEQLPALDNGYAYLRHTYGPDRPGLSPRVAIVGYSMGGLVARLWASQHPGVVTQLMNLATPNAGTDAVTNFFTLFISRCASGALHDLSQLFVTGFNATVDLTHYWDPDPATMHFTTVAGVPPAGERTDGLVPEESANALPYATHLVWTPDDTARTPSLHIAIPHAERVYTDLRAQTHFTAPVRDARTG